MSRSPDYLYDLLPAIYRMRDAERGLPLRDLLRVISEQVDVVEKDIARLYENWFIETCDDWVVPYIGDLIGHRPVEGGAAPVARGPDARHRILVPRREVAGTLGLRRRKGTLALLEDLAAAVAGWPARAVEFYALLGWTQHLDHQRPQRGRTTDLRDGDALDLIDGPFDRLAHTVDVRRIVSHRTQGRSNTPSVGVFVWRLRVYSVTHTPAYCLEERAPHLFTFSALGNDTVLHTRPEAETKPTHIAEEINLPTPIRRRALEERLSERPLRTRASAAYYGEGKSLSITAPDWPTRGAPQPVPRDRIVPADLSDWRYRPAPGYLAVDPVLGRIAFPSSRRLPKHGVWVSYHYAFSADMGGGEYDRPLSQPEEHALYRVSKDRSRADTFPTIGAALAQWRADQQAAAAATDDATNERLRAAVIEIDDSAVYVEPLAIALEAGESVQIRAANRRRPIIRLLDYMTERPDAFSIAGKRASRVALDGLIIAGRGVQISGPDPYDAEAWAGGDLCDVRIRHCTLVPGWSLHCDCEPKRPNEPSLELLGTSARIAISHSIVGSIQVSASEVAGDPIEIDITDSIVDATSLDRVSVGAAGLPTGFVRLSVARTTVLGTIAAHAMALAENSIFASPVFVARRQPGCVRYCYVAPGSRTPRRHRCQPDLVRAAVDEQQPPLPQQDRPAAKDREAARVRPVFVGTRYGTAEYCRLALACAEEIRRGADDEAEMGAFHDLFQPQRAANLRARLDEYTPADMEAGIVYAHEEFGR